MSTHVMLDLETWATSRRAVITEIGAVKFDSENIIERFHVGVDPKDVQRYGQFNTDAGTIMWWIDPDRDAARKQWLELGKIDLYAALDGFAAWVQQTPADQLGFLWGNGAGFDNAILREAFEIAGIEFPFRYSKDACYRTLKNLFPGVELDRVGTWHTSVDDAESQARHLQKICAAGAIVL